MQHVSVAELDSNGRVYADRSIKPEGTSDFPNTDPFECCIYSVVCCHGPVRNLDLALIKQTAITETFNVEFRAEAFNLMNTPPLGVPNVVLRSAGFGSITSAGDPRVLQFGLKLNF